MSSKRAISLLLASGAFALAGCNTANSHIGDEDPFMGEAVKYNAAIQTINPTPVYPPTAAQPGDLGAKGAEAVKRYRTDKVKQIETMETTGGTSGSGSR
jgi:hypothetical protein